MKSIILTYPGFQALPRGLKQMLVASENEFFSEARPPADGSLVRGKLGRQPAFSPRARRGTGQPGEFGGSWQN